MKNKFKKVNVLVMSLLLILALGVNSFALTTTDDATDFLGCKSLLLTVDIENKDYFSYKTNLISILNNKSDLYGALCFRSVDVIFGASEKTDSDSAIVLIELTFYGSANIETIKAILAECEGVKSAEIDGIAQINTTFAKGDVNCDGLISSCDARLALRYSVGLEKGFTQKQIYACDFDDDGTVSAADARSILRKAVEL